MTAAERRHWLGDQTIAEIRERVAQTPEVPDEDLDDLRRILAGPAGRKRMPEAAA